MASYAADKGSVSTSGMGVKVAATGSPGTTIHTATAGATNFDEVWMWAVNTSAIDVLLTIQFGGVTAVDNDIPFTVKAKDGLKIVLVGNRLNGGLLVKAYADTTNVIVIYTNINRITA